MGVMVNYYYLPPGSVIERNAGIVVAFGNWPHSALRNRGWTNDRRVAQRLATEAEHKWLATCMRFQAYRYPDIESMLEDEAEYLEPATLKRISIQIRQHIS